MAENSDSGDFALDMIGGETTAYKDGKPVARYTQPRARQRKNHSPARPDTFVGAKLKLERAKRHISEIEAIIQRFHETNPYSITREKDANTGQNTFRVQCKESVPVEISGPIGDAVHNLRTALDYIVCDLIRAEGKDPNGRGMLIGSRAKRLKLGCESKIQGVSPDAERFICSLHSRKRWHRPIRVLHKLDVFDRHNRIQTVSAATIQVVAQVEMRGMFLGPDGGLRIGGPGPGGRPVMAPAGQPRHFSRVLLTDDEVEVYRSPAGFNEDVQIAIGIAFSQTEVAEGEPVVETLKEFAYLVEQTIRMFERLA